MKLVIPYICNQTITGDPDKRTGFWWFYDHWDDYAHEIGPKPPSDPIEWMQREPDGSLHFNYPHRFPAIAPLFRFAPCPNNPRWHGWLRTVVRLIAEDGYDGVFVDNNRIHCWCGDCQREFHTYLRGAHSPAELRRRYRTDHPEDLRLATNGDRLLWAASQPEFLPYVKEKHPDEFHALFGTDDPVHAVAAEAGYGENWFWANEFRLKTLGQRYLPHKVDHILRTGDITDLGVETLPDLCLWADTQKFWAWTIGCRNAELRAEGETVRPGFILVPNWGGLTGMGNRLRFTVPDVSIYRAVRIGGIDVRHPPRPIVRRMRMTRATTSCP